MKINNFIPNDVVVLKHMNYTDERGSLNCLYENNDTTPFIASSFKFSKSKKNVARGIHWQKLTHPQTKIITVLSGKIEDFLIDLDHKSDTFGHVYRFTLNANDGKTLVIPSKYGHGFVTYCTSIFIYLCSGKYSSENELSFNILEYTSDIFDNSRLLLSQKDKNAINFSIFSKKLF